ncbi:MAG: hypothetical protein WB662_01930, partial [Methyloceanibacter sp.]
GRVNTMSSFPVRRAGHSEPVAAESGEGGAWVAGDVAAAFMDELSTVAHDALMRYKGFVIIWVEPPISAHEWVLNINPADRAGLTKLSRTKVIKGATLEEAKDEARKFIDDLLA